MIKKLIAVLCILSLMMIGVYAEDNTYELKLFELSQATDSFNIEGYTVLESEKEEMHNADKILRRNYEAGIAWIVFEVPYITDFKAVAYHYPQDIENMSYEVSKDGEAWTTVDVTEEVFEFDGKWTRYEYTAENIEGARYIKVVWGEEAETNHWWTPYFEGLYVNMGEGVPTEIIFEGDTNLQIPQYDSKKYDVVPKVIDQIGLEVDVEIELSVTSSDERIALDEENKIEIFSDMAEGTEITVSAICEEFSISNEVVLTLTPSLLGDADEDNKLTEDDAKLITDNYGKTTEIGNRLCDINKDGKINIIDLAYVLRYME